MDRIGGVGGKGKSSGMSEPGSIPGLGRMFQYLGFGRLDVHNNLLNCTFTKKFETVFILFA
jgi:hypothetical protein